MTPHEFAAHSFGWGLAVMFMSWFPPPNRSLGKWVAVGLLLLSIWLRAFP